MAPGRDLWLREADGSTRALTDDGAFNYGAHWIDTERVLFLREHEGRVQAHQLEVMTGTIDVVTDAPFSAFDATPMPDGQLAFLNREGWNWSLAKVSTFNPRNIGTGETAHESATV